MKNIDARGLSCPQPMLLAKNAMQSGADESIEILVDCAASVENIGRAARREGWEMRVSPLEGAETKIELHKK